MHGTLLAISIWKKVEFGVGCGLLSSEGGIVDVENIIPEVIRKANA